VKNSEQFRNRSIIYVSTAFILTNNNWLNASTRIRTYSPIVISENKCCADVNN